MRQNIKNVCSFFLLLNILIACKERSKYRKAADEIAAELPDTKNLNVGKENYTLYIPNGWTTEYKSAYGIDYYFLLAPKTEKDPNTNINVITEYMQNLTLNEFAKKTIESVEKAIPTASIKQQGNITANGLEGSWYSYTMNPQGIEASLVCYIFPKGGVAYTITAGTQTKDAIRYRSTFDSVAKSLKFKEY